MGLVVKFDFSMEAVIVGITISWFLITGLYMYCFPSREGCGKYQRRCDFYCSWSNMAINLAFLAFRVSFLSVWSSIILLCFFRHVCVIWCMLYDIFFNVIINSIQKNIWSRCIWQILEIDPSCLLPIQFKSNE